MYIYTTSQKHIHNFRATLISQAKNVRTNKHVITPNSSVIALRAKYRDDKSANTRLQTLKVCNIHSGI